MEYEFSDKIFIEGNRGFIKIPFNVWETFSKKGNIPCIVKVNEETFECKLVPKGNGVYYIPISKFLLDDFEINNEVRVAIEPIETLSRINKDSPYSKEHPIRKIESVTPIEIESGFCGHALIAMLTNESIESVKKLMGNSHASWSKILEALDYYGISYAKKAVYTKGREIAYPPCCIVINDGGFLLYYKGEFIGVKNVDNSKTVSYIEILL